MKLSILFFITFISLYAATNGLGLHTKKKLLIAGVGAKLLGKAVIGGLVGKKVLHRTAPCARATVLYRRRRSISDYANQAFNGISSRLESTGKSLRSIGDTFHRGSDRLNSASLSTRVYGLVASDRIRSSLRSLTRTRRAAPRRPVPGNLRLPSGKLTLDEMLNFVKEHNAEICLQRVICELSSKSNIYGDEGVRFGTRLLGYNNANHRDASKYKQASAYGNRNRGRPEVCRRKYAACNIDPQQLIQVGNLILN